MFCFTRPLHEIQFNNKLPIRCDVKNEFVEARLHTLCTCLSELD